MPPPRGNVEVKLAPPRMPWQLLRRWHDEKEPAGPPPVDERNCTPGRGGQDAPTTPREGKTYIDAYHDWVAASYSKYVNKTDEYLCNWWPLRLLVEYAALNGLPVRLNYWPGSASVDGGERKWSTDQLRTLYSHDGTFADKTKYYNRVKGTVTARMLGSQADEPRVFTYTGGKKQVYQRDEGQLAPTNTLRVSEGDVKPGDIFSIAHYGLRYWHCQVVVGEAPKKPAANVDANAAPSPKKYVIIQGNTPKALLEREQLDLPAPPDRVVRWNFAQFDA